MIHAKKSTCLVVYLFKINYFFNYSFEGLKKNLCQPKPVKRISPLFGMDWQLQTCALNQGMKCNKHSYSWRESFTIILIFLLSRWNSPYVTSRFQNSWQPVGAGGGYQSSNVHWWPFRRVIKPILRPPRMMMPYGTRFQNRKVVHSLSFIRGTRKGYFLQFLLLRMLTMLSCCIHHHLLYQKRARYAKWLTLRILIWMNTSTTMRSNGNLFKFPFHVFIYHNWEIAFSNTEQSCKTLNIKRIVNHHKAELPEEQ